MSSPESNAEANEDDEEEIMLYRFIFDMNAADDKEGNETPPITPSPWLTPEHLKTSAEGDGSEDKETPNTAQEQRKKDQEVNDTKEPKMHILDNIQQIHIPKLNTEEKPWKKAGADITDYFNYGFNEESWNTYCKKQSKLRGTHRQLSSKLLEGHTRHEEESSHNSFIPASRHSSAVADVIGRRLKPSNRRKEHPYFNVEESNTKVTEVSLKGDRTAHLLPSPSGLKSLLAFTPPQSLTARRRRLPRPLHGLVDSGHSKGFDDPAALQYPCSSGVSALIPRSMACGDGMIATAKAEMSEKGRARARERGHDKDSKGDRDRQKENSTFKHNSEEGRMRHRDTTEQGHRRHTFKRCCGAKETQHQERRHRDKSGGGQKSACRSGSSSSKSRSNCGEDRDSQSRRKHKKARRDRRNQRDVQCRAREEIKH